jgi:hypothetical protein
VSDFQGWWILVEDVSASASCSGDASGRTSAGLVCVRGGYLSFVGATRRVKRRGEMSQKKSGVGVAPDAQTGLGRAESEGGNEKDENDGD